MLPLLRLAAAVPELKTADAVQRLGRDLALSPGELATMLPSGLATTFGSRVGWAKTYLKQAGALSQPRRGVMQITERGRKLLESNPGRIDNRLLMGFPEFLAFRARTRTSKDSGLKDGKPPTTGPLDVGIEVTPEERIDEAAKELQATLADELLAAAKSCRPAFFEELVIQLLLKMGYGGSRNEAGKAVGRSGDGGIDGVINEDRLGLDSIYVQAKRWQSLVGEPDIRNFVGALVGRGATKGVFITTSDFSVPARQFVTRTLQQRIVLIDGERLAELMIEHGLGISIVATYQIKRIDSDFFSEE
jgi:restriction system protein